MIELLEEEKNALLTYYKSYVIDEQDIVQNDWKTRKFKETGRYVRCVEHDDGSITIKQIGEFFRKNWVTVSNGIADEALKWAKQYPDYITNDFSVIDGRTEQYQKGDDYYNTDFFFMPDSCGLVEFDKIFGVK